MSWCAYSLRKPTLSQAPAGHGSITRPHAFPTPGLLVGDIVCAAPLLSTRPSSPSGNDQAKTSTTCLLRRHCGGLSLCRRPTSHWHLRRPRVRPLRHARPSYVMPTRRTWHVAVASSQPHGRRRLYVAREARNPYGKVSSPTSAPSGAVLSRPTLLHLPGRITFIEKFCACRVRMQTARPVQAINIPPSCGCTHQADVEGSVATG